MEGWFWGVGIIGIRGVDFITTTLSSSVYQPKEPIPNTPPKTK